MHAQFFVVCVVECNYRLTDNTIERRCIKNQQSLGKYLGISNTRHANRWETNWSGAIYVGKAEGRRTAANRQALFIARDL